MQVKLKAVYRQEQPGKYPYLIFHQSTPGIPTFKSYADLEAAAMVMEHLGLRGLKPQLFHLVERIEAQ